MSIVSHNITGFPRPVGSEFRQRRVFADDAYGSKYKVPWVVSVVDTPQGPMVEARKAVSHSCITAVDLARHGTTGDDLLAQVKALLDEEDGWTRHVVKECRVDGCANPQPMWHNGWSNNTGECLPCSMRTVLACVHCGAPDNGHWEPRKRDWMLAESICFLCACWLDNERRFANDPKRVVTDEYSHYVIRGSGGPSSSKGFGGQRFVVTFHDGRVVETDDLWHQGAVPEWLRDRFTPNGAVVSVHHRPKRAVAP